MGKLANFSALALVCAGVVKCAAVVSAMPPGTAAFVMAPGQKATAIGLDALGKATDILGVPRSGATLDVLAPEGRSFVFAGGARGKSARVELGSNSRARHLFTTSPDSRPADVATREVALAAWSRAAALSPWSEDGPAPSASAQWRFHWDDEREREVFDGALYRYALAPGQGATRLDVPYVPLVDSERGYSVLGRIDYEFEAPPSASVRVSLDAPPGMKFGFPGGRRDAAYSFDLQASTPKNMIFELVAENGWSQKMELRFAMATPVEPVAPHVKASSSFRP